MFFDFSQFSSFPGEIVKVCYTCLEGKRVDRHFQFLCKVRTFIRIIITFTKRKREFSHDLYIQVSFLFQFLKGWFSLRSFSNCSRNLSISRFSREFTYSILLSNFLKNRSILFHKSFSNLFPNRNRGGERGRESIRGPHAWYPRQTYSPRTGTTPKESRSRKSRGTREINQAGRRVKWTETRFGAIKGPSTNWNKSAG